MSSFAAACLRSSPITEGAPLGVDDRHWPDGVSTRGRYVPGPQGSPSRGRSSGRRSCKAQLRAEKLRATMLGLVLCNAFKHYSSAMF